MNNIVVVGALVVILGVVLHGEPTPSDLGTTAGEVLASPDDSDLPIPGELDLPIPLQGTCGDHQCQPPEDCHSCPQDCGDCCGNRRCEPPEDCRSCPQDCGSC